MRGSPRPVENREPEAGRGVEAQRAARERLSAVGPAGRRSGRPPCVARSFGPIVEVMASTDRRKQCVYFSDTMLDEIKFEAARLDRSMSWVVQTAWKVARGRIMATPSANDAPSPAAAVVGDARDADPNEY